MIYIYWPGKYIPTWLAKITFSGESTGVPVVEHGGFGVVIKKSGWFNAVTLFGPIIRINGAGMSVTIACQGRGLRSGRPCEFVTHKRRSNER